MRVEEIAADLEFSLIEPDVASIPARQGIAKSVPDPKADVVTDDGPCDRNSEYQPGRKAMGVPGIGAGQDERSFARDGYSQTFRANENEYRHVAIDLNEVADVHGSHRSTGDGPATVRDIAPDCHASIMILEDEGTMTTDDIR
jgi:hypothetical protein